MSKLNLIKEQRLIVEPYYEEERIGWVHLLGAPGIGDLEEIGTTHDVDFEEGMAAISAFCDLFGHGIFDHPLTDGFGGTVFVREGYDPTKFYKSGAGYITAENTDKQFPAVDPLVYPDGAMLNWKRPKWKIGDLDRKAEIAQARYLEYLVAFTQGLNLRVRVLPYQSWITVVLKTMAIEDPVQRLEIRNKNYNTSIARTRVYNEGQKVAREVARGNLSSVPQGPIVVKLWNSEEEIDIASLDAQTLKVHTPDGEFSRLWDRGPVARVEFAKVRDSRYSVELLS